MDDDYAEQVQSINEVSKIQEWDKTTMDDPHEQAFQAEVNEVFQRYGRQYPGNQFRQPRATGQRFQGNRFHQNRNNRFTGNRFSNPLQFTPRHQSTTVAN